MFKVKSTKTEVPVNVPLLEVPMRLIKKYEPLRKELQEFALSNGVPMLY